MASPRYMEMIKTSALKLQKITERRQADLYSAQTNYMHRDKGNTAADSRIRTAVSIPKGVGTNGTLVHEMSHSSDRTGQYRRKAAHNGCKRIAMFSNSIVQLIK
jgi:hypothetical protein